jgi:hypothetical protein
MSEADTPRGQRVDRRRQAATNPIGAQRIDRDQEDVGARRGCRRRARSAARCPERKQGKAESEAPTLGQYGDLTAGMRYAGCGMRN